MLFSTIPSEITARERGPRPGQPFLNLKRASGLSTIARPFTEVTSAFAKTPVPGLVLWLRREGARSDDRNQPVPRR